MENKQTNRAFFPSSGNFGPPFIELEKSSQKQKMDRSEDPFSVSETRHIMY